MRYLPLVWAAIVRKPTRAVLTLLSVAVAFTLFGLMMGLNATFDTVADRARADRVYTWARFGGTAIPLAVAHQIAAMPGVKSATAINYLQGYVQDPKNPAFVLMVDQNAGKVFGDWLSPEQWNTVMRERTGVVMTRMQAERWHKKVGDTFTIICKTVTRADGGTTWTFRVVAIAEDIPQVYGGFIFGNYDYIDRARPLADQGKIGEVDFVADDPANSSALAGKIDRAFANSATPMQTITEKLARSGNDFGGLDIKKITFGISLAGMFMVLFLTGNGIAESVRERYAEFATLKTIGFSDLAVTAMVVLESALPCVIGAVLGVGLASALARQIPKLMPSNFSLPVPTMSPVVMLWAAGAALAVAVLSAALPVLRLRQMDIASALSGRA
jgi:putative ABC transport system permease protein